MAEEQVEVINTASLKLPAFYTDDPETWFLQADAVFKADRITSQATRFYRAFGQLPRHVVTQVADLATTTGDTQYDALKERLIAIYGTTKSQKIQETLDNTQLGDQRPSQLLRKMKFQMGSSASEDILRVLWTRALPTQVQAIIAAWDGEGLDKVAEIADRVIDIPERPVIAPITKEPQILIQDLQRQVKVLTDKLDLLQSPRGNVSQTSSREDQRHCVNYNDDLCYYHKQWGSLARNCRQPCRWKRFYRGSNSKNEYSQQ